jgi:hypothetical protein
VPGELEVHVVEVRLAQREPINASTRLHGRFGERAQRAESRGATTADGHADGPARGMASRLEAAEGRGQQDEVGVGCGNQVQPGLPGLCLELGASTMALYYYVRTKADIVALMQDAILADILIPPPSSPPAGGRPSPPSRSGPGKFSWPTRGR